MTPEEFLGRVRALLPVIRERAPRAEQLRRLPDETFADFQEAGLFRAMQPKRYGGFELDPEFFYQAITEVGAVCGSSGWVFAVVGVHNWHLALFPPQAQEDVWGEDDSIQLSTSLAPTGKVERVDGGYRVSGRWSFSSGCDFCGWAVLGGIAPPAEAGGPPDARTFLLPRADYAIDDNWQVMGLCGSGSKDIVVADAFVPDYRTHSYLDAFHLRNPGTAVNDGPLYRLPFGLVFA
jgi:3-hydroxy-9,10-secoandrosta-1,3,5(10)-triene-9,17-dione monooxygenase